MSGVSDSDFLPYDVTEKQLFSRHFQDELLFKVVAVNDVVQKFIDSKVTSEDENTGLKERKVADSKLRYLIRVINERCNKNDLSALKSFITVLDETKNIDLAKQLKLIHDERENAIKIMNVLSKEKHTVENLKREINRLCELLKRKESDIDNFKQEKKRLVERSKQTESELKSQVQYTKKELQARIGEKEKLITDIEAELGEIRDRKGYLEVAVREKTIVIDTREQQLEEKERELQTAIGESNLLKIQIENLQKKVSDKTTEDKQKLLKIEELENEISLKENCIMELRQKQTMSRDEVETELRKIYDEHALRLDEQAAIIRAQSENIKQQNDKIDQLTSAVGSLVRLFSKESK